MLRSEYLSRPSIDFAETEMCFLWMSGCTKPKISSAQVHVCPAKLLSEDNPKPEKMLYHRNHQGGHRKGAFSEICVTKKLCSQNFPPTPHIVGHSNFFDILGWLGMPSIVIMARSGHLVTPQNPHQSARRAQNRGIFGVICQVLFNTLGAHWGGHVGCPGLP